MNDRSGMARRRDPQRGTARGPRYVGQYGELPRRRRQGGGPLGAIVFLGVLAIVVVVASITFIGPALRGIAWDLARSNPDTIRWPFMADVVKDRLGDQLTTPAGDDPTPIDFRVDEGATVRQVGNALVAEGLIVERLTYDYLAITRDLGEDLKAGRFVMSLTMTPEQVVEKLAGPPDPEPTGPQTEQVNLRAGLRIEQITALLKTYEDRFENLDVEEFYRLATEPPAELEEAYAFLALRPEGASLEGFLAKGLYNFRLESTAEDILRGLLDEWQVQFGDAAIEAAEAADKNFFQVLTLASIVEKEATNDEELRLIAGVYQNRLDGELPEAEGRLDADPTVFYARDTGLLRELPMEDWPDFLFWAPATELANIDVPDDLERYQSYRNAGMIPGPIATPRIETFMAALDPDQEEGFLYFVSKNDDSKTHDFSKTYAEHQEKVRQYQGGG